MSVHSYLLSVTIGLTAAAIGFQFMSRMGGSDTGLALAIGIGLFFVGVLIAVYGYFYLLATLHSGTEPVETVETAEN